jgi:hypothetical protein
VYLDKVVSIYWNEDVDDVARALVSGACRFFCVYWLGYYLLFRMVAIVLHHSSTSKVLNILIYQASSVCKTSF